MWPPLEFSTRVVNCRKHDFDVFIGRPGPFGNPHVLGKTDSRVEIIKKYRAYLAERVASDVEFKTALLALRGKRLGCFCAPALCHGHVIDEYVEAPERFVP